MHTLIIKDFIGGQRNPERVKSSLNVLCRQIHSHMEDFKMSDSWDIGKDSFPGFRVVAKLSFGFLAWVFMNDWLECSKTSNTMSFLLPEFKSWVLLTYPDHLPLRQVYSSPCVVPNKHWDSRFPETTHFHLITACVSVVYTSFFILSKLLVRVPGPKTDWT